MKIKVMLLALLAFTFTAVAQNAQPQPKQEVKPAQKTEKAVEKKEVKAPAATEKAATKPETKQEVKAANFILEKNKFIDVKLLNLIKELLAELEERTVTLSIKKANASAEERQRVQILRFELELLVNFYKQRLLSVANGLFYLNDRPYSISIYLMFGAVFMRSLIKNVTFREELV